MTSEAPLASDVFPAHPTREFRWHVRARWIVAAFLALAAVLATIRGYVPSLWPLLVVSGGIMLYNWGLLVVPWRLDRPNGTAMACLVLDVFALTTYLHYSGDIENPLILAYSLPVVTGSVILSRRAGFVLAGLAGFLFITLLLMTALDDFPIRVAHHHLALVGDLNIHAHIDPDDNEQGWNYILTNLIVLMAVLFGSAHGFGTLAERLREKERDLREENGRLLLLLSILPEGVVLLGKDGAILHANSTAQILVNGAIGRSIKELDPGLGLAERFSRFAGNAEEFELTYRDRILDHALARHSPDGPVVWVFRDMTDQRRLMAQVVHRAKVTDLGLLAAGIAHEIGNPLSSMSAVLQLMEKKNPTPEIAERIRSLESHVTRISRIVQDVTGFARPSSDRRIPTDARALLEKALHIFRFHEKAKEIRVESDGQKSPVPVRVVEDQIVQVLLNLLLNAADASSGRGTVTVSVESRGDTVRISVDDRGAGISPENIEHLFTPFFTTKEQGKGVGLGLFVSESIARLHDGRIEVQSVPGKGATFTLVLPKGPGT
jgi:signal transduction histidine kinase